MNKIPKYFLAAIIQEAKEKQSKVLDLSNSSAPNDQRLIQIPAEVFELEQLEVLNLRDNLLTFIPDSIARLQNLTWLDLSGNRLTTVPDSIAHLRNLTSLSLSHNQFTVVPDSIAHLQNLTLLSLSHNQLTAIPDSIAHLRNLTRLYISHNQLTAIPDLIAYLRNLTWLHLSHNRLTIVPDSIAHLRNLTWLDLQDNPIEIPPPEVVKRGVEAIKAYFQQLEREGQDYLYEAKLLIVGEGGAGKTTLTRKIENPAYQLCDEDSTTGIEVIQWRFPMKDMRLFRVNIWDFGGQEIYHATHQFFLTKRSLYALVADTRKEDTDFYYWLNVIELLSDNSPLLIIKNEKQDRQREINERQLRGQFTNLEKMLATNLATNRGLPEILAEFKHQLSHLPHIGTTLPKTWVKVREALENDLRNHISLDEYLNICQQHGFNFLLWHEEDKARCREATDGPER
jgi:GTPase SAR1 family protein